MKTTIICGTDNLWRIKGELNMGPKDNRTAAQRFSDRVDQLWRAVLEAPSRHQGASCVTNFLGEEFRREVMGRLDFADKAEKQLFEARDTGYLHSGETLNDGLRRLSMEINKLNQQLNAERSKNLDLWRELRDLKKAYGQARAENCKAAGAWSEDNDSHWLSLKRIAAEAPRSYTFTVGVQQQGKPVSDYERGLEQGKVLGAEQERTGLLKKIATAIFPAEPIVKPAPKVFL